MGGFGGGGGGAVDVVDLGQLRDTFPDWFYLKYAA